MTSKPSDKRAVEPGEARKTEAVSPDNRPGRSDTPPPLSMPNDVDAEWAGPAENRQVTRVSAKDDALERAAGRSLFTPSFTLLGSGPMDPSRQAGRAGVLAPGSTFGVYKVGACIGEGGMARVYQAEHAGLRRQVALKVLIDGFARDPDGRERFLREARLAAAIKHPNVVNIFDVGVHDDIPYLVMEFLEGQDLEKLLESKGAQDESMIVDIMIPVVAGLSAVHDAGIVHRDLKPGNIFLAKGRYNDLEPKLLDFGISKAQGPEQMRLTASRGVMGTPFYISPEGLHGGEMTPLSDQYSLGVVMYECATGCTPYNALGFTELSRLIVSGQYTPPSTHKPELSKRLARIIERAMSLQPQNRFKDMREMGRELLTLAGQRTRVTWGLSFGDLHKDGTAQGAGLHESVNRSPPAPTHAQQRRPAARLWIAPVVLAVAGLLAWRSGMVSFGSGSRPLAASGPTGTVREEARAAAPPAASDTSPQAWVAPNTPPSGLTPSDMDSKTTAAADSTRRVVAHGGDPRPPAHSDSVPTTVRRNPRSTGPAGRRPTSPNSDSEPEWALPAGNPSPGQTNLQIGANDSPIFD